MTRILAAGAVSGAVAIVPWLILTLLDSLLLANLEELERLAGWLAFALVALFLFVIGPLVAGLSAGWVSRSVAAAIGSVVGYVAVSVGVGLGMALIRGSAPEPGGALLVVVVSGVLVVAGHLTGVAARPGLRPA